MEKRGRFILIALFLIVFSFSLVTAIDIDSCQSITSEGYYKLNQTILARPTNPCIDINSNNTEIDCDGYAIRNGTTFNVDTAIKIDTGSTIYNITIRNCNFTTNSTYYYFNYTIYGKNVNGITIVNLSVPSSNERIFSDGHSSVGLEDSTNILIENNVLDGLNPTNIYGNAIIQNNFLNSSDINSYYIDGLSANWGIYNNTFLANKRSPNSPLVCQTKGVEVRGNHSRIVGNTFVCLNSTGCSIGGSCVIVNELTEGETEFADNIISSYDGFTLFKLGNNTIAYDNIFNQTGGDPIFTAYGSKNAVLINTSSFSWKSIEFFLQPENITRQWKVKLRVVDINGTNVSNALVQFFHSDGTLQYSGLTDSNGLMTANISEFKLKDSLGSFSGNTSYIYLTYPTYINVSKFGDINESTINIINNTDIIITMPFFISVANSLPFINSIDLNQIDSCVLANTTLNLDISATDIDSDPIYYSYQCSLSDSATPFTLNNSGTCTYSNLGAYVLKAYVNDSFHDEDYVSINRTIYITKDLCVKGSTDWAMSLSTKLVDKDNIDEGILPTIYYGIVAFVSSPLGALISLGMVFLVVMTMITIFVIIGKLASGGR